MLGLNKWTASILSFDELGKTGGETRFGKKLSSSIVDMLNLKYLLVDNLLATFMEMYSSQLDVQVWDSWKRSGLWYKMRVCSI